MTVTDFLGFRATLTVELRGIRGNSGDIHDKFWELQGQYT